MGRELRRVPVDFDAPINATWQGYLMPDELCLPACPDCKHGGSHSTGRSLEAETLYESFWPHNSNARLAWMDKIGQAEVDELIAHDRLRDFTFTRPDGDRVARTPQPGDRVMYVDYRYEDDYTRRVEHPAHGNTGVATDAGIDWDHSQPLVLDSGKLRVIPAAAQVNAWTRKSAGPFAGLGSSECLVLTEFRCRVLGIVHNCPTCGGVGDVGTAEQRAACEAWERTDPPTGDGFQLWETTSEGSPQSPVFTTVEQLARWCETNATTFGSFTAPASAWLNMFRADLGETEGLGTGVGTMLVLHDGYMGPAAQDPAL